MRNKLICSALRCVHNVNALCSAGNIHVTGRSALTSGGTECETFAEKGLKNAITNLGNMNITGEIRQLFKPDDIAMSPDIKCEAVNCVYNREKVCSADYLQIYGPNAESSSGTLCETFKPAK